MKTLTYRELDTAYSILATLRWLIFLIFLGCLSYTFWAFNQWQDGRWTQSHMLVMVGKALGASTACIVAVGLLDKLAGDSTWSERTRRGFRVILRQKDEE